MYLRNIAGRDFDIYQEVNRFEVFLNTAIREELMPYNI